MLLGCVLSQKWIEIITGISIPYTATLGSHFYIGHFGGIIINANAVIGDNCNISQGVTIGVSGVGYKRGVPVIGHDVYIGANAVVAGNISIGDGAVIGANSLVTRDVMSHTTVLGVPAVKINDKDSKGYI
ncbi:serine O-acetyltransferase [Formosa algae]|uniref:serine O-acetyltransferase n=1 Tax=Formosa algae TaxID=225843 RepID=UPI00209C4269|nr:DapH/DapD/GlmU-related protein [Formosa algae]